MFAGIIAAALERSKCATETMSVGDNAASLPTSCVWVDFFPKVSKYPTLVVETLGRESQNFSAWFTLLGDSQCGAKVLIRSAMPEKEVCSE